jgi:nucleotide-binding universal stress UspA family protein
MMAAIELTDNPMPGILKIAYKLLINDRTKFAALLVGGFGHGPFRERMFGGVTQAVIEGASVPVFLVH